MVQTNCHSSEQLQPGIEQEYQLSLPKFPFLNLSIMPFFLFFIHFHILVSLIPKLFQLMERENSGIPRFLDIIIHEFYGPHALCSNS